MNILLVMMELYKRNEAMCKKKENQKDIKYYSTIMEQRCSALLQSFNVDMYSSMDAPGNLWRAQEEALLACSDKLMPQKIREQLQLVIVSLEQLCERARRKVSEVPDGDSWLEYWK